MTLCRQMSMHVNKVSLSSVFGPKTNAWASRPIAHGCYRRHELPEAGQRNALPRLTIAAYVVCGGYQVSQILPSFHGKQKHFLGSVLLYCYCILLIVLLVLGFLKWDLGYEPHYCSVVIRQK